MPKPSTAERIHDLGARAAARPVKPHKDMSAAELLAFADSQATLRPPPAKPAAAPRKPNSRTEPTEAERLERADRMIEQLFASGGGIVYCPGCFCAAARLLGAGGVVALVCCWCSSRWDRIPAPAGVRAWARKSWPEPRPGDQGEVA